jgi:putative membrane protein
MKLIFWLLVLIVAAWLALFAVANRESVSLGLWPLPYVIELPLYLAVLGAVLAGFIVGGVAGWSGGQRWRREARRRGRRIAVLERELVAAQAPLPGPAEGAPGDRGVRDRPAGALALRG